MFYQTRVMVAVADFLHGADLLRKGDTFIATQIDADYLHSRGKATFAPEPASVAPKVEASPPAPAPAPAAAAPASAPAPAPDAPSSTMAAENAQQPDTVTAVALGDSTSNASADDAGAALSADQPSDQAAADAPTESAATEAAAAPAPATGRRRGRAAQNSTASE